MSQANGTTAIAVAPTKSESVQEFELMQRRAAAFAMSPLVPEHLRPKDNPQAAIANCYICLELAKLMNESPLVVMQNIHFVKGKPGWNAAYMIARANASGYFSGGIKFKTKGAGDTLSVTASAVLKETGETVERTVDMAMAKSVGWFANEKYRQIPEQMLSYRAATFLIRLYCPQVMLGYHTADELHAMPEVQTAPALTIASVTNDEEPATATGPTATLSQEPVAEAVAVTEPTGLQKLIREARANLADVEHASDFARLVTALDADLATHDPGHKSGDLATIARRAAGVKDRTDLAGLSDKQLATATSAVRSHLDTIGSDLFGGAGNDGAAKPADALKH